MKQNTVRPWTSCYKSFIAIFVTIKRTEQHTKNRGNSKSGKSFFFGGLPRWLPKSYQRLRETAVIYCFCDPAFQSCFMVFETSWLISFFLTDMSTYRKPHFNFWVWAFIMRLQNWPTSGLWRFKTCLTLPILLTFIIFFSYLCTVQSAWYLVYLFFVGYPRGYFFPYFKCRPLPREGGH